MWKEGVYRGEVKMGRIPAGCLMTGRRYTQRQQLGKRRVGEMLVHRPQWRLMSLSPHAVTLSPWNTVALALYTSWLTSHVPIPCSLTWGIRGLSCGITRNDLDSILTRKKNILIRIFCYLNWVFSPAGILGIVFLEVSFSLVCSSWIMSYLWIPDVVCSFDINSTRFSLRTCGTRSSKTVFSSENGLFGELRLFLFKQQYFFPSMLL